MEFKTQLIKPGDLTPREAEILCRICDAETDKQIARALEISLKTVTCHIEHIHRKLTVSEKVLNKRVGLLRIALKHGLIRLGCLVLAVSALQSVDNAALAARVRVSRPQVSSRRFE